MRGRAPAFCGVLIGLLVMVGAGSADAAPANGRAWELVTPAEPVASSIDKGLGKAVGVADDGERLVYQSLNTPPGGAAGELIPSILVARTPSGWQQQPGGLSFEVPSFTFEYLLSPLVTALSADLSRSVAFSWVPLVPGGPEAPRIGIYRVGAGSASLLADLSERAFVGASADLTHVAFMEKGHLLPSDAGRIAGSSVYEAVGSQLRQVDVADDGSLLSPCGSSTLPAGGVSDSGERVFFANPGTGFADPVAECGVPRRVFLREAGSSTVEISASRCTRVDCGPPGDVDLVAAAADGSAAFLATRQQLTNADEDSLRDLYRYQVGSGALSLVSPRAPGMPGEVTDEVVPSADGSAVYFQVNGRLAPDQGSEGGSNLYIADQGGLRLVAPAHGSPTLASRDGGFALFATATSLSAADADEHTDAYLYDAGADRLTRVSGGVGGGNGAFDARIVASVPVGGGFTNTRLDAPFTGSLTADGRRVFFETAEQLLPEDRNEAVDVYEWTGGALGLVSSGAGADDAAFLGSDADGRTALFKTAASLLSRDRDGGDRDIYASRIGGGFAEPVDAPPACERCRPAPPPPLTRPLPATAAAPTKKKGALRLRRPAAEAGAALLATGSLALTVQVPAPGRVSARAMASLGGKARPVAATVAGAVRAGKLRVRLPVSAPARRRLARQGVLRLRLVVSQGALRLERRLTLTRAER